MLTGSLTPLAGSPGWGEPAAASPHGDRDLQAGLLLTATRVQHTGALLCPPTHHAVLQWAESPSVLEGKHSSSFSPAAVDVLKLRKHLND